VFGQYHHFCVGAVLDRVRNKHPLRRQTERSALRNCRVGEFRRSDEDSWNPAAFEIDDVVHTARRAAASVSERFNDRTALTCDEVAQIDRSGFGECWLAVPLRGDATFVE
jgi:hypothetical protein